MRNWLAALLLVLSLLAGPAEAQTYRWVDDAGAVHYTQGLESIPERHRSQARLLDLGEAPPTPAERLPVRVAPPAATERPLPPMWPAKWEPSGPLPEITRIPFTPGSHILVDATINGKGPVPLMLDTGSDATLFSAETLETLSVSAPGYPCRSCPLLGIRWTGRIDEVKLLSLKMGEAELTGRAFVVEPLFPRYGGILGRSVLDNFLITIDPKRRVVTLVPTTSEAYRRREPNATGAHVTRLALPPGPRILVDAKINGKGPVALILDTGTPITEVTRAGLQRLGVSTDNALRGTAEVPGGSVPALGLRVASLEVGAARVGPLVIGILEEGPVSRESDGLLGLDFLKDFTVTIDPGGRVVTLEGPGNPRGLALEAHPTERIGAEEGPRDAHVPAEPPLPLRPWLWVASTLVGLWFAILKARAVLRSHGPIVSGLLLFLCSKRRLLTPLRELLDYPSSKTLGGYVDGNRLRGQFRGRSVVCSLTGTGWGPLEFSITLSCRSRWGFVVSRRTGFSFAEWLRGLLPIRMGRVVFEVGDVEFDRKFRVARWVDKTMGIDPREPCAAWLRRPEVRHGVESLLLSRGATRLGTSDDPAEVIPDVEAWYRSGAPIPDGLQVTYARCRTEHLEVGNVRAVLEELEKLGQSLPTSLGPWEPSFPPHCGVGHGTPTFEGVIGARVGETDVPPYEGMSS